MAIPIFLLLAILIALSRHFGIHLDFAHLGVLFPLIFLLRRFLRPHSFLHPAALIFATALFLAITSLALENRNLPGEHPLAKFLGEERSHALIEARILDGPTLHERGYSFDVQLLSLDSDPEGMLTARPPKLRIFYPTDDLDHCEPLPLPGDRFQTWARLERFAPREVPFRPGQREVMEGRGFTASAVALEPLEYLHEELSLSQGIRRSLAIQRIRLERRLQTHLDGDGLAIAAAMLTGSRGTLTPELRAPFDITSTGHILAISGLHFAVIAALITLLLRLILDRFPSLYLRIPRHTLVGLLAMAALFTYLLAIGAPISARRAFGMMALFIALLTLTPLRISPLSALAVVASTLLFFQPSLIAELGFQLSVAATAGICAFLRFRPPNLRPPLYRSPDGEPRLIKLRRRFLTFCGVSLSATIATWPILLQTTAELPLAAIPANLVLVPLVSSLLFPAMVAGALLSSFSLTAPLASFLLEFSTSFLLLLREGLDLIAYHPLTALRWGTPTPLELIGFSLFALLSILGGLRPRITALAFLLGALFLLPAQLQAHRSPETLSIHFIPVGQGDAVLIHFPDGAAVLVDAGGAPIGQDPGLNRVAPYLRHLGIRRLDAIVISHAHFDHYGGIPALLRPFRPRRIYFDPFEESPPYLSLLQKAQNAGAHLDPVDRRAVFNASKTSLQILRPPLENASPNDRSLVVALSYAGAGVLLPGDLEAAGEAWLREALPQRRAILKVPHHGSRTSSQAATLETLQPRIALVSAGRHNRFGHPHPEILDRYQERGISLYRTDLQGAIQVKISADGAIRVRPTHLP